MAHTSRMPATPQTLDHPRQPPWTRCAGVLLACSLFGLPTAQAQDPTSTSTPAAQALTEPSAPAPSPSSTDTTPTPDQAHPETLPDTARWRYTLGLKLKSNESADGHTGWALRPVLGVRYGRWRLGHATGDDWFKFSNSRESTNLAYDWRDDEKFQIALSARVQNIQDNDSFDGFGSGKNTVRGRVSWGYTFKPRWSMGGDVTQDLLNRGDGRTVSLGLSYAWPLSTHSALSLSTGTSWASAEHWATQMRLRPEPQGGWRSGLGEWAIGARYRQAITPRWAWFGTLGTSRYLRQAQQVNPSQNRWNGQIGLLYFSR